MKLSFLASAVVVIFAAAPEKSRAETIDLPEQYIAFFACADRIATEQVYAGLAFETAFSDAMKVCEEELDNYLAYVVRKTTRRGGWSSVRRSVPPAIKEKIIEVNKELMRKIYSEKGAI